MKKKLSGKYKLLFFLLIPIIFLICCITTITVVGISIFLLNSDSTSNKTTTETTTIISIVEDPGCTYVTTPDGYISKDTPDVTSSQLISSSKQHFTFSTDMPNSKSRNSDEELILTNLENQYCRLTDIFSTEIQDPIDIKLVHDADIYESDLGTEYEIDLTFTAFAEGDYLIEIYDNPADSETDKYKASTLSHELVHIFQYSTNPYWNMPNWFIEGMATAFADPQSWLNNSWSDVITEDDIKDLLKSDITRRFADINLLNSKIYSTSVDEYAVAYDTAHLYVLHLIKEYGESKVVKLVSIPDTKTFEEHFEDTLKVSVKDSYKEWVKTEL